MNIADFAAVPFWSIAVVFSLLAAFFVLRPWLRAAPPMLAESIADNAAVYQQRLGELADDRAAGRIDAQQYQVMEQELRAALADDARLVAATAKEIPTEMPPEARVGWPPIAAVVVALPLVAIALYDSLGAYDDVLFARQITEFQSAQQSASAERQMASAQDGNAAAGHEQLELIGMVRTMRQELSSRPDDSDGWFMLGRSALTLKDFDLAVESFARVAEIVPDTPAPLAYLAQSQYLAAGRKLTRDVRATIDKVLELVPDEPIMLEMLAVDAFEQQDYRATIDLLQRGLAKGVNPERRGFFEAGIARARLELGEAAPVPTAAVAGPAILVDVDVAAGLDLPPGATVFVAAKAEQGPPMPLAVARHTVAELPVRVRLDAAAAMSPAMQLQMGQSIVVSARVSRRGTADRSADDVETVSPAFVVPAGELPLRLVLGGGSSLGSVSDPEPPGAPVPTADSAAGQALTLLIEAAPHVEVAPSAVLFVFAREVGGPPMPLAVDRRPAAQLPALVRLDDSMAMMPGRTLSAAKQVEVVARLSMSGAATPASGDWEGSVGPLVPGAATRVLNVLIDRRLP